MGKKARVSMQLFFNSGGTWLKKNITLAAGRVDWRVCFQGSPVAFWWPTMSCAPLLQNFFGVSSRRIFHVFFPHMTCLNKEGLCAPKS